MSRKSGAQAGESKPESRFAALTSGLLARKGQAAPSNSPLLDAADETEAFTPGDALIPRKHGPKDNKVKPPSLSPLAPAPRAASPPAAPVPPRAATAPPAQPAKPAAKTAAPPPPAPAPAPKAPPALEPQPRPQTKPQPITIINERSFEAGYPNNPTAEEIAAIEAEADEVVTYFEKLGGEAIDADTVHFFDEESPAIAARDPLDDLDDDFDDRPLPSFAPAADARTPAASHGARATVSAALDVREFMRLSLGAAEMRLPVEVLVAEAIEEFLDARGVDSLGGDEFLKKLSAATGSAS